MAILSAGCVVGGLWWMWPPLGLVVAGLLGLGWCGLQVAAMGQEQRKQSDETP